MNTLKRISLGLSAVLCILLIATALPVFAEVQVFIDAHTVRVYDPVLKRQSILNDFRTSGYRVHNHLALVWSEDAAWVYDVRTQQWLSESNFRTLLGSLSDEYALVWNENEAAIFDAKNQTWIRSDYIPWKLTGASLSRGMTILTGEEGLVVYDPVLKKWLSSQFFPYGALKKAQAGDVLAAAWSDNDLVLYDMTIHDWVVKEGISPQACIIDGYKASIFTADTVYTYDAINHRWSSKSR